MHYRSVDAVDSSSDQLFLINHLNGFCLFFTHTQGVRENSPAHWYKNRSVVKASMKARQMLTWILGKEDTKFKNCENLQVL